MDKLKATPEQVKWLYAHRNDRTLTDAAHEVAREYDRNYRKKKKAKWKETT